MTEHGLSFEEKRTFEPVASGQTIELLKAIGGLSVLPSLATIVCAWLKNKRSRKVMITLENNTIIQTEGLSETEIAKLLENAKGLSAIDPGK